MYSYQYGECLTVYYPFSISFRGLFLCTEVMKESIGSMPMSGLERGP